MENIDSEFDFSELSNEILKVMQTPTNDPIQPSSSSLASMNQINPIYSISDNLYHYTGPYSNSGIWNNMSTSNIPSFKGNPYKSMGYNYYQSQMQPTQVHLYSNDQMNNYKSPNKALYYNSKYEQVSNEINVYNIMTHKDLRTTLMIRHIPNKYNISAFLEDINKCFKGKYDILYLPLDFVNNCNLGYAFINFVDPLHIVSFYDQFRGKKWSRFKSEKICELAYAKFQGRNDLITHFKKGATLNFDSEEKKPIILPINLNPPNVEIPIKYYMDYVLANPWQKYDILQDKIVIQ